MTIQPKFINADDLVAELRDDLAQDCNRYMYWYQKEERGSKYIFAIDRIKEAPTADVAEVVNAQWVLADDGKLICNNCKDVKVAYEQLRFLRSTGCWNYCPNCGAKMDR